jgi:hypothetical protein
LTPGKGFEDASRCQIGVDAGVTLINGSFPAGVSGGRGVIEINSVPLPAERPVFLDIETRNTSDCSLRLSGAWCYGANSATEVVTLTYRLPGEERRVWVPALGRCDLLADLAADPAAIFVCHAGFEQAVWQYIMVERHGFAPIPIERWRDTQAACAYHALPLDLAGALGWRKFHALYCSHMPEEFARKVIDTYRNLWAQAVPLLWRELERAAFQALFHPGIVSDADCGVQYRLETKAGLPFLVCRLSNGKKFYYANARVEEPPLKWDSGRTRTSIIYEGVKDHHWRKVAAWDGHLCENVVQGIARELLVDTMFRFDARRFPVVMHCHDEIVVEHPGITAELT